MTESAIPMTPCVPSSVLSRLPDLVGGTHVIADPVRCAEYEVDGLRPAVALRPGSVTEIAEILRFANAERLAVIPMGGRTKIAIGMPPERFDLALDLSRMNRMLAYDPRDLTCAAEAGLRFADLDCELGGERQFLPLAPAFADRATLGGVIAAGADSPLRYAYGSARDYLLGVEFVTGDAVVSKSGGRVVKNVTGYDLHKLLIGSLGTLAVITRLNFRTFPLPPEQRTFVASFASAEPALAFCAAIAKSPLQPKLVEVLDPGTAQLFATRVPAQNSVRLPPDRWCTVVTVAGQHPVVQRHAQDLTRMAGGQRAVDFAALDDAEGPALLRCISEFPALILETVGEAAIFRVAVLPSQMADLLRKFSPVLDDQSERHTINRATLVRAAGVVYIALLPAASMRNERTDGASADVAGAAASAANTCVVQGVAQGLVQACRDLIDLGMAMGVRPVLEWCPLAVKRELAASGKSIWPPAGEERDMIERLKAVFDPHRILSPGRFHGGV